MLYVNWAPQEPNNNGGHGHCVTIGVYQNELWDDDNCAVKHVYVCETSPGYIPEPELTLESSGPYM